MEEDDCHPRLSSDLTCVLMVLNSHSCVQTHTSIDTCHFNRSAIIVLEILTTESVNSHSGTDGVLSFPKWKIFCQVCPGLPPGSWGRAGPLFRLLNPLYCVLTGPFPTSRCNTSGIISLANSLSFCHASLTCHTNECHTTWIHLAPNIIQSWGLVKEQVLV